MQWGILVVAVVISLASNAGFWWWFSQKMPSQPTTAPKEAVTEFLLDSKITEVKNEITALKKMIASPAAAPVINSKTTPSQPATTATAPAPKTAPTETILYLGSGSIQNRLWTRVNATQISLDPSQYGKNPKIELEVGMSIISGEVYARFVDTTTGAIFTPADIMNNTSSTVWKKATLLALPTGSHTYVVELRSSSDEVSHLEGARLKITSN